MKTKKVGEILPGVMKGLGLDARLREAELGTEWRRVVGDTLSARSRPLAIRNKALLVEVANGAWMQEIRYHQREILAKIHELFPELEIEGLRLMLEREKEAE